MTQSKIQMFGAWCGVLYVAGLIIGWWIIAGFVPPHLPTAGAAEIAGIFQAHVTRIRVGMVIVMFAAMIVGPFSAAVAQRLARIEGGAGMLAYCALLGGAATMVLTFYPAIWWLVACFRPDRGAELLYLINDTSWLQLIGGISIFLPLPVSVIVAAFCDDSPQPAFPRWAGWLNLWILLGILPDQLMFFFHVGPFAWNGLFGFWIPLVLFGGWFLIMFSLLRTAILRDRALLPPARSSEPTTK